MSDLIFKHPGNKYGETPEKMLSSVVCPLISAQIDCNAATGVTQAVEVPAGAIVYRVAVLAETAITSGTATIDIDVGDGVNPDRYFDALAAVTKYDLVTAPVPATTTTPAEVGGRYYATADTIDVDINATALTGSIRILVWYAIDDTGILP